MSTTATATTVQQNIDSLCHQIQHMDLQDIQKEYLDVVHQRLARRGIQETYSSAIIVKMLSGEIVPLGIHIDQATKMLSYGFVAQLGYNPSVVGRLSFMDENGESVLQEKSWRDVYGSVGMIPVVHVLIQEEEDTEWPNKLPLLRRILFEGPMRSVVDDEEIRSLYLSWKMYEHPGDRKPNRWNKLVQFIHHHPAVFVPMTQEEVEQRDRTHLALIQETEETEKIRWWIHWRKQNQLELAEENHTDKERIRGQLTSLLQQHPTYSLVTNMHNQLTVRRFFSIPELLAMGFTPNRISTEWWIVRWHEMSAKAEAYLADPMEEYKPTYSRSCTLCGRNHD